MKPPPYDAWVYAKQLAGATLNGELAAVSAPFRPLANHLNGLEAGDVRQKAWNAALSAPGVDGAAMLQAVLGLDPSSPLPDVALESASRSYATLADYARIASDQRWLWHGWIARGVFNAVAAEPGTGKTRFALDLARRLYLGMPWPDGQATGLPEGSKTLWIQADRAFPEMLETSRDFGLPDDAVALGSSPDDPTGSLDLDDPETIGALAGRIQAAAPVLVVIDTVGMTTSKNLCRPEDARAFFGPLMELAASSGVAFLGLTHLSKDKEALGRRIVEKARVVIKMTKPDPEGHPNRRKLWVDKTAAVNPPALGITMGDSGNEYDFSPPKEVEPMRGGRPSVMLTKAIEFVLKELANMDRKQTDLISAWEEDGRSKPTIFDAFRSLKDDGRLLIDDNVKPKICRLVRNPDPLVLQRQVVLA